MTDSGAALAGEALKTWGSLGAFVVLAILAGWQGKEYLVHKDILEFKRFEARQAREKLLAETINSTCGTLQKQALTSLARNRQLLERLDARGNTWLPVLKQLQGLAQRLDSDGGPAADPTREKP